ncbi:autotransporter-associated beta strand repeat-containing protein, partial [Ochrobactrum sp. GPK 3]
GGDGVAVVGIGSRFENFGTVTGGDGGQNAGDASRSGNAGAGIRLGHDAYVVNAGTVRAGLSYNSDASTHTGAIEIVGANATLELRAGSDIQGKVHVADGITDAKLVFGGAQDLAVDVGIGIYDGFAKVAKTGAGTLTLTGVSTSALPWRVEEGLVAISQEASFGNDTSTVTLAGGGIQFGADQTLTRTYTLEGAHSVFDTQAHTVTLSNSLVGNGGLVKKGTGTLIVTGENSYTGG